MCIFLYFSKQNWKPWSLPKKIYNTKQAWERKLAKQPVSFLKPYDWLQNQWVFSEEKKELIEKRKVGVIGKMVEKEREAWGGPSMWRHTAFVGPTTFQLRPQCGVHHNPPFPFPTSPFSFSHWMVRTTTFDLFSFFLLYYIIIVYRHRI